MRPTLLHHHVKYLIQAVTLLFVSGIVAGCSSGFSRFNGASLLDAAPQGAVSSNAYPGDLDATTTSSVEGRMSPASPVMPRALINTPRAAYYHKAEPTYVAPQAQTYSPPVPDCPRRLGVEKSSLPAPSSAVSPKSNLDMMNTSSVQQKSSARIMRSTKQSRLEPVSNVAPQPIGKGGWSKTGNTTIEIRSGETLYNISKRYGVPVNALMKANSIASPDSVEAGQRIVIPNYSYSSSAPVSAPDHNINKRASTSRTGMTGKAKRVRIVPIRRPQIAKTNTKASKPDTSIITGALKPATSGGTYVVARGDSLSRIAVRKGVSLASLKSHNNIKGSSIRIGQKLHIPSAGKPTKITKSNDGYGVDPIVTGSVKKKPVKIASNAPAPKRTGISEFRWPVRGRVIKKFNDKNGTAKNDGIDISVPEGTAVRAVENGVVLYVGEGVTKYGRLILIRHEDGWVSAYAHNKSYEVAKGDAIRRGQIIARSGRTGTTSQPKLHFELRKNSKPVNPLKHLGSA
ncbi:MAG: peptidoglycan DD-metalloendopeptidase family protein [Rhizobiaceae bacterium]|nr:peptidoglycan DD-metalloendopeptidase family protein [Rhizobiaceae bacterium]